MNRKLKAGGEGEAVVLGKMQSRFSVTERMYMEYLNFFKMTI